MAGLSEREYGQALAILAEAALGTSAEPLPAPALEALRRLIPCDLIAYFEGRPVDRAVRRRWITGDFLAWSDAERQIMDRFRLQDPLQPSPANRGRSMRISDFMSTAQYRRLDLYNLLGRFRGMEFSMSYWMATADGVARGFMFDDARRDFTARDQAVMDTLGPPLARILGRFDAHLPATARDLPLTRRQAEILAWVARGLTNADIGVKLSITADTVRTHLENVFARLGVHSRAAAIALAYDGNRSERPRGSSDRLGAGATYRSGAGATYRSGAGSANRQRSLTETQSAR